MNTLTHRYLQPLLVAASLVAGSALAAHAAAPADKPAADAAQPSEQGPGHGGDRHGAGHGPDRHHGGPRFDRGGMRGQHGVLPMRELRGLDLSDSQRKSIRETLVKNRDQQRSLNDRERDLDRNFDALDPTAKDYKSHSQALSDQAGKLARERVLAQTALRAQIYTQLTPEQVKQLQTRREERSARRAEFEKRRQERKDEALKKTS